tara:strand:+ start:582 stop:1604 length:1023 start_codon:yes stop_codon:yes gene_type:complete
MKKTLIIAEVGVNHNGDIDTAKKLIFEASKCGADIVKFQTFKTDKLVTSFAKKTNYQIQNTNKDSTIQKDMLKALELSKKDHLSLIDCCKENNIEFLSTAFDIESLQMLLNIGINRIKIPSGEITNLPYLREIGLTNLPIILSTGMANLEEINNALNILTESGRDKNSITVLHCTSEYPAPYKNVNLKAMNTIKESCKVNVGYSDHTLGIEVSIAAVSLGASIIEKHITLNKSQSGPDHKASLDPKEFELMVKGIRIIEKSLGIETKKPSENEIANSLLVRKSIVASRKINKGDIFTSDNLTCKRPFNGISPMKWDEIIGKTAEIDYEIDDTIIQFTQSV